MDATFFDYLERIVTCISPIIIAWYGFKASKSEKQTKKYLESQEELKKLNNQLKEKEKEDLQEHFDKLDNSISALTKQVQNLETSMSKITEIDKRIDNLIKMSDINFEFCTSLSAVISSIGNALDSTDIIESGSLQDDLGAHKKKEQELINRAVKIVY